MKRRKKMLSMKMVSIRMVSIRMVCMVLNCAWMFCLSACATKDEVLFLESTYATETDVAGTTDGSENVTGTKDTSGAEREPGESLQEDEYSQEQIRDIPEESIQTGNIVVHVCGAVMNPGVYELSAESRVMDAVTKAGGMTDEADAEYVNLATVLSDGDKVRIPTKDEVMAMSQTSGMASDIGVTTSQTSGKSGKEDSSAGMVNINTADVEELCTLPGIGQTRAESIVAYRTEHGGFSTIEDIMQVSGIKESSFQKIKSKIVVE